MILMREVRYDISDCPDKHSGTFDGGQTTHVEDLERVIYDIAIIIACNMSLRRDTGRVSRGGRAGGGGLVVQVSADGLPDRLLSNGRIDHRNRFACSNLSRKQNSARKIHNEMSTELDDITQRNNARGGEHKAPAITYLHQ